MIDIEDSRDDGAEEGYHNVKEHVFGIHRGEQCYCVNRLSEADSRVEAPTGILAQY